MTDRYNDGRYVAENPSWHAEDAAIKADAVLRMLARTGWTPARIADVGCGTGDVLRLLRTRLDARWGAHATLTGWDTSADVARLWHEVPGVTLKHGAPEREHADLVLALDVSEHVPDDVGFLRRLGDVAPRAILRMPLDDSWLDRLRPARRDAARERLGHVHAYDKALALKRVAQAGWHVVRTDFDRVPPRTDTLRQAWMDRLRRAGLRIAPNLAVRALGGWSLVVAATRQTG